MSDQKPIQQPLPGYVRLLAVLMTLVVSGLGALALVTGRAPGRSTRFGYAGPLDGIAAYGFGLSIFLFGLIPLMLLARSFVSAAWFAGSVAVLALAVLLFTIFIV